ncbi:hypothetical protein AB6A40_010080 [Gnathostoma spinigerum]|uniref:Uncharacterized protein n=1 Tax=Gnathostoma spinigerum TaxID=75299 RepID=A0ABD6EVJ6_9BILA
MYKSMIMMRSKVPPQWINCATDVRTSRATADKLVCSTSGLHHNVDGKSAKISASLPAPSTLRSIRRFEQSLDGAQLLFGLHRRILLASRLWEKYGKQIKNT